MSRRTLLITGANGFLARAVVHQIDSDWQLAALVRPGTSHPPHFPTTHESVARLIADLPHVDVVMHLAACIPSPLDAAHPELIPVNVKLVDELAQAYPEARHVLASSVSVFGVPTSLPIAMDTASNKPNAYGLSKLSAENLLRLLPNHAVIRFSSLIGRGMKGGSFIPVAVAAARTGNIRLLGSGERLQNYLDIDDAASMCVRAATNTESFIALGIGDRSHSNNEVAAILADLTGASIIHDGDDSSPSYVYQQYDCAPLGRKCMTLRESLERMVREP